MSTAPTLDDGAIAPDEGATDAPLDDLADEVARRTDPSSDPSGVWDRLEDDGEGDPARIQGLLESASNDVSANAGSSGFARTPRADGGAGATDPVRSFPAGTKVSHGVLAAACMVVASGVYLAAATGSIPDHLWITGIPVVATGLVLLLPVLAWHAGLWTPARVT